jgi:hypothetical protein
VQHQIYLLSSVYSSYYVNIIRSYLYPVIIFLNIAMTLFICVYVRTIRCDAIGTISYAQHPIHALAQTDNTRTLILIYYTYPRIGYFLLFIWEWWVENRIISFAGKKRRANDLISLLRNHVMLYYFFFIRSLCLVSHFISLFLCCWCSC